MFESFCKNFPNGLQKPAGPVASHSSGYRADLGPPKCLIGIDIPQTGYWAL